MRGMSRLGPTCTVPPLERYDAITEDAGLRFVIRASQRYGGFENGFVGRRNPFVGGCVPHMIPPFSHCSALRSRRCRTTSRLICQDKISLLFVEKIGLGSVQPLPASTVTGALEVAWLESSRSNPEKPSAVAPIESIPMYQNYPLPTRTAAVSFL
jgi:hypothetical protein